MTLDRRSLSARLVGTFAGFVVCAAWVQYCVTHGRRLIQPDTIISIYCIAIGQSSPEASCPNAELMVLFPLLIIIALIYYAILALLAISPIGVYISGIFLIWRRKARREPITSKVGDDTQIANSQLTDVAQAEHVYSNLKVINSSKVMKFVARVTATEKGVPNGDIAEPVSKVTVRSAIKDIINRTDSNA